jgi:hypothetical protein
MGLLSALSRMFVPPPLAISYADLAEYPPDELIAVTSTKRC